MLPCLVKQLVDFGENVIIDEVIFEPSGAELYLETLKEHDICFVGVSCESEEMSKREIARGDRVLGLSNGMVEFIHKGLEGKYDLTIDTTNTPATELANKILGYFKKSSF